MNSSTSGRRRQERLIYSTSRFASTALSVAEPIRLPASEVHAKEVGTTLTICGESALSWFKFWDRPFRNERVDRCAQCVSILSQRPSVEREV